MVAKIRVNEGCGHRCNEAGWVSGHRCKEAG